MADINLAPADNTGMGSGSVTTGDSTVAPVTTGGMLDWMRSVGGWPGPGPAHDTEVEEELMEERAHSGPRGIQMPWFLPYFDQGQNLNESPAMRAAYRIMLSDPNVKAAFLGKVLAVGALDLKVIPASRKDPADAQVAEFVRFALEEALEGGVPGLIWNILSGALIDGYSICEKVWDYEDQGEYAGKFVLKKVKPKDTGQDVVVKTDAFRNITKIEGLRYNAGKEFDPAHFIIFKHLPLWDQPTGQSDFRAAYQPWWMLDTIKKLWAQGLDKNSMPILVGQYARAQQKPSLANALARLKSRNWLAIPADVQVTALEIAGGSLAAFDQACMRFKHEIFLGIQGAILQSLEGTTTEGRGDSSVHRATADLLIWYLATTIEALFNDRRHGLVRDLVDLNYAVPRYPRISLSAVDYQDVLAQMGVRKTLYEIGMAQSRGEIYDAANVSPPDPDDPLDSLGSKADQEAQIAASAMMNPAMASPGAAGLADQQVIDQAGGGGVTRHVGPGGAELPSAEAAARMMPPSAQMAGAPGAPGGAFDEDSPDGPGGPGGPPPGPGTPPQEPHLAHQTPAQQLAHTLRAAAHGFPDQHPKHVTALAHNQVGWHDKDSDPHTSALWQQAQHMAGQGQLAISHDWPHGVVIGHPEKVQEMVGLLKDYGASRGMSPGQYTRRMGQLFGYPHDSIEEHVRTYYPEDGTPGTKHAEGDQPATSGYHVAARPFDPRTNQVSHDGLQYLAAGGADITPSRDYAHAFDRATAHAMARSWRASMPDHHVTVHPAGGDPLRQMAEGDSPAPRFQRGRTYTLANSDGSAGEAVSYQMPHPEADGFHFVHHPKAGTLVVHGKILRSAQPSFDMAEDGRVGGPTNTGVVVTRHNPPRRQLFVGGKPAANPRWLLQWAHPSSRNFHAYMEGEARKLGLDPAELKARAFAEGDAPEQPGAYHQGRPLMLGIPGQEVAQAMVNYDRPYPRPAGTKMHDFHYVTHPQYGRLVVHARDLRTAGPSFDMAEGDQPEPPSHLFGGVQPGKPILIGQVGTRSTPASYEGPHPIWDKIHYVRVGDELKVAHENSIRVAGGSSFDMAEGDPHHESFAGDNPRDLEKLRQAYRAAVVSLVQPKFGEDEWGEAGGYEDFAARKRKPKVKPVVEEDDDEEEGIGPDAPAVLKGIQTLRTVRGQVPPEIEMHLHPEDWDRLRASHLEDLIKHYYDLPEDARWVAAAHGGRSKLGWYQKAYEALVHLFPDENDRVRFTSLLAATSPRLPVNKNLRIAVKIWTKWIDAGRPGENSVDADGNDIDTAARHKGMAIMGIPNEVEYPPEERRRMRGIRSAQKGIEKWDKAVAEGRDPRTAKMPARPMEPSADDLAWQQSIKEKFPNVIQLGFMQSSHGPNAMRSLFRPVGVELRGPKVRSFQQNLLNHLDYSTNDVWMANFADWAHKTLGSDPGYAAMTAKVRKIAAEMNWHPAEVQETIWSYFRELARLRKGGRSPQEALADLSHEGVRATVDFANLFLDDPDIQKEMGDATSALRRQSDQLRGRLAGATGGDGPGEKAPFGRETGAVFPGAQGSAYPVPEGTTVRYGPGGLAYDPAHLPNAAQAGKQSIMDGIKTSGIPLVPEDPPPKGARKPRGGAAAVRPPAAVPAGPPPEDYAEESSPKYPGVRMRDATEHALLHAIATSPLSVPAAPNAPIDEHSPAHPDIHFHANALADHYTDQGHAHTANWMRSQVQTHNGRAEMQNGINGNLDGEMHNLLRAVDGTGHMPEHIQRSMGIGPITLDGTDPVERRLGHHLERHHQIQRQAIQRAVENSPQGHNPSWHDWFYLTHQNHPIHWERGEPPPQEFDERNTPQGRPVAVVQDGVHYFTGRYLYPLTNHPSGVMHVVEHPEYGPMSVHGRNLHPVERAPGPQEFDEDDTPLGVAAPSASSQQPRPAPAPQPQPGPGYANDAYDAVNFTGHHASLGHDPFAHPSELRRQHLGQERGEEHYDDHRRGIVEDDYEKLQNRHYHDLLTDWHNMNGDVEPPEHVWEAINDEASQGAWEAANSDEDHIDAVYARDKINELPIFYHGRDPDFTAIYTHLNRRPGDLHAQLAMNDWLEERGLNRFKFFFHDDEDHPRARPFDETGLLSQPVNPRFMGTQARPRSYEEPADTASRPTPPPGTNPGPTVTRPPAANPPVSYGAYRNAASHPDPDFVFGLSNDHLARAQFAPMQIEGVQSQHNRHIGQIILPHEDGHVRLFWKGAGRDVGQAEERGSRLARIAGLSAPAARHAVIAGAPEKFPGEGGVLAAHVGGTKLGQAIFDIQARRRIDGFKHIEARLPPGEIDRQNLFSFLVGMSDRHTGNYMVDGDLHDPSAPLRLHTIDHEYNHWHVPHQWTGRPARPGVLGPGHIIQPLHRGLWAAKAGRELMDDPDGWMNMPIDPRVARDMASRAGDLARHAQRTDKLGAATILRNGVLLNELVRPRLYGLRPARPTVGGLLRLVYRHYPQPEE